MGSDPIYFLASLFSPLFSVVDFLLCFSQHYFLRASPASLGTTGCTAQPGFFHCFLAFFYIFFRISHTFLGFS